MKKGVVKTVKDFFNKHRERVTLIGVGLAFLIFVGGGIYLQKKNKKEKEPFVESAPKTVELKKTVSETKDGQTSSSKKSSSYFLKPSPDELLNQLASMEGLNENVTNAKFSGLRVMWPVYFFSIMSQEEKAATVLLDVSEDGFGVEVQSEIDTAVYPEIIELKEGDKFWIAGEILAVDPAGTGTVFLKMEHLRFSEDGGISRELQKETAN